MENIKLGDRITVPSKNVKGEVVYIGKPHFADGTWIGIVLDIPVGKHNGTIDNKCYFKSARDHGIFIKASYFEREGVDISSVADEGCKLISKGLVYPNYQRAGLKPETKTTSAPSKCITSRKIKKQNQNENFIILEDNVTNTNEENTELMKVTESDDNNSDDNVTITNEENTELMKVTESDDNNDDFDEKKNLLIRRYPNYLKASSKVAENNFCLNKNKCNKADRYTGDDVRNNDKNLMLLTTDNNDSFDKDKNQYSKRITYPNYLKASSKLAGKNLCTAKRNDVNADEINETHKKTVEIDTSNGSEDNKHSPENTNAYLIKYPYHPKTSKFNENYSCSARKDMCKPKSMSKNEHCEILKNVHIEGICDKSVELETVKRENEYLQYKLKSTEESLEEIVNKYADAQEKIKHLKYDNECQRKQIKFQKNHLKLLKMSQSNNFTQTDSNKISKQKKMDEILEIALNKHDDRINISEGNCDFESMNVDNSMQRVLELEEQNKLMVHGLVELRNFLKTKCESQTIELELLNPNYRGHSPNRSNKKCVFSESSDLHVNSEEYTRYGSVVQLKEYSEMLQEMTKFNELIKEKRQNVKDSEAINLAENDNILPNTDLNDTNHSPIQSEQDSVSGSTFDMNDERYGDAFIAEMDSELFQNSSYLKKNDIEKNYQIAADQNSQYFPRIPKMKEKINEHHVGDGVPLEPADCMSHQMPTKNLIYNESTSLSNTTLTEQEYFHNAAPEYTENCSSKMSEVIPGHSTSVTVRSKWDSPIVFPKAKESERKILGSTKR